jgi:cytochrome bd-type quinol oxidase subunit 2
MVIILLLFIAWRMITCCLGNQNDSMKFSIMKSVIVFYFIGSSIYIFYSYMNNYSDVSVFNTFTNLLNIYFVGFIINILIFISYRIYKYYKENNNQETEYSLLEN